MLKRIAEWFKGFVDEIKKIIGRLRGEEANALKNDVEALDKISELFHTALENTKENTAIKSDGEVKYSFKGVDENGIEIYETSNEIKALSYKERKSILLDSIKNEYLGRTAKFTKNDNVYYAKLNQQYVKKGIYGDKKSDEKGYKAKINIGADGNYFELTENSLYSNSSKEQGKKTNTRIHENVKRWDYFIKTVKSDGNYFDVLINIADKDNDQYVYDVTLKENKKVASPINSEKAILHLGDTTSNPTISQDKNGVNSSISKNKGKGDVYSLKDSQGNTLTKEQAEFFKDSKVRDEDGNLLVVYHGSPNEFTVFDESKYGANTGSRGFYGSGFYFATSETVANSYGGNITKAYLNAKKLLDLDANDWTYLLGIEERPKEIKVKEVEIEEAKKGFLTLHYTTEDEPNDWKAFNSVSKMRIEDDKSGKSYVQRRLNPASTILPRDIYNLAEIAREKGYDGIIGDATNVGDTGKEIVVFSPNQIKSVDNLKPTSDDDIRYSLKHTFANEMKKAIEQKNNSQESHIEVGKIPSFYSRFGFDISKPMTITAKHIRDITTPKNVNHSEYHGLAQSQVLDAIKSLNQPVTVLSSHKEDGTVVIVTNVIDNDNIPISIYIHPNGTAYINNKEIKSTHIRSIYGRDNVTNYFNRAVGDGRVLYFDKKRSQELNKIPGVYFPNNLKNLDFNNNVSRYRDIVNNYYMQNGEILLLKHKDMPLDESKLILQENEELKNTIELRENRKREATPPLNSKEPSNVVTIASNLTISQDKNGVNSSISENQGKGEISSLKDSQGRTLTKEQAEFLKDSKVRDEDGNLLVVYHGSPKYKNKTHNWLSINRLQLPLHITNYEFLNAIKSQRSDSVNSSISENGGKGEMSSLKDSQGRTLTKEQAEFLKDSKARAEILNTRRVAYRYNCV